MNKTILLISLLLVAANLSAADVSVGRIVEVKGEGFISKDGKTKEIRKGDQLFANSEIVVEHKGQVTFTDNADHRFHLGNSSSVSIGTTSVELRNGDIWFQSLNKSESYQVKTANAQVDYQGGEAILSYDSNKGKTQLMVINGMMKLSNLRTTEFNLSVAEGNFSFIDVNYEEGAPRDPTPVGEKTYHQLVSMFKGISPLDLKSEIIFKHEEPKREIASVHTESPAASAANPELDSYKEKLLSGAPVALKKAKKVKVVSISKATPLLVQIYGQKKRAVEEPTGNRMPASVKEEILPVAEPKDEMKTKETENLLQALKNI